MCVLKRFISFVAISLSLFSLWGCKKQIPIYSYYSEYEIIVYENEENNDTNKKSNDNKTKKPNVATPSTTTNFETVNDIVLEEIPEQQDASGVNEQIFIETAHTAVLEEEYYQYNSLTNSQKLVYKEILNAIKETKNIIRLNSFKISNEEGYLILQKVLCDHPEFFYVSKYTSCVKNPFSDTLSALVLYYTDGITVDKIDDNLKLYDVANRDNINRQVKDFNKKVEEILCQVPLGTSQVYKEKFIHNYIILNTQYDTKAAATEEISFGQAISHDWDVYGALVEGWAVCEGYSKAFAYLCRCVGINATTICGTSQNVGHMWNAVMVDDEWYLTDVTWDDSNDKTDNNFILYQYFNCTSQEFLSTHSIETNLAYPTCTATKNSFYNTFAIDSSSGKISSNYKTVIDEIVKYKEGSLVFYIGNNKSISPMIKSYVTNQNSPIVKYIKDKKYNICFTLETISYGNYICYTIKYS